MSLISIALEEKECGVAQFDRWPIMLNSAVQGIFQMY
jgi:hypothetical protein